MKLSDAFMDAGEHQARIQPVEVNVQVITDRNANGVLSEFISLSKEADYLVKIRKDRGVKMYKKEANGSKGIATLFISYTTCDRPIVDMIQKKICEKLPDKIKISRFDNLKYKDSFRSFMNTIGEHDFLLAVVSDTYLKSKACMYEVSEVLKDRHYKDKLLFVVLSESERDFYKDHAPKKIGADIYSDANARLNYIFFWEKQYNRLNERIQQVSSEESKKEAIDELQIIGQIYRKDIGEFLQFLSDENGKSFKELYENGFEDLIQRIVGPIHLQKNVLERFIDSQLEELYHRFPQNTEIVNSFANSLFKLSQNEDKDVVFSVVDYLERIYSEHPSLDVALKLAMSLTNLSTKRDDERIKNTVSRVQSLYVQYSDCLELAVVYTKCLVNCTNYEEALAQAAIEQLRELHDQYADNTEIMIYYADGLVNRCLQHRTKETKSIVKCLKKLYQDHLEETDLAIKYAEGLKILSGKQNVSDAILTSKRIERLCMQNPNIIDIAVEYIQCLVNLSAKESQQGVKDIWARIEKVYDQYPDEPRIISGYAMGLYNYQQKQNLENALSSTKRMADLYDKHPHVAETSLGLARCLVDLSTKQDEEVELLYIVARLEYLFNKHPYEDLAVGYAIGLYNLCLKQNKDGLRTTLARFESLRACYPDNERIASEFACFRAKAFGYLKE